MAEVYLVNFPLDDLTDDKQHWFIAWRHQAITWANVDPDLCRHMASQGPNELTESVATRWYL